MKRKLDCFSVYKFRKIPVSCSPLLYFGQNGQIREVHAYLSDLQFWQGTNILGNVPISVLAADALDLEFGAISIVSYATVHRFMCVCNNQCIITLI